MTSAKDLAVRLRAGASTSRSVNEHIRKYQALCDEAANFLIRLAALGEPDADLVERLRKKARYGLGNGEAFTVLLREAADTIEGLNLELAEANAQIALNAESRTAMCLTIHEAWKALGVENHDGSDRRSLAEAVAEANAAREEAETEREAFRADIAERRANAFDLHTKLAAAEARLATVEAALREAREALASSESWLSNWAEHIGRCKGDGYCTCGLTAIRFEARAALHPEGQKDQVK